MRNPRVCVLKTDGINCDEETRYAFGVAGADALVVHVNELREKRARLDNHQILAIPGGFSYGDDVASGKILANELATFLKDELLAFIERGGLIIGICNGFQVLVQAGLLPARTLGEPEAALATNASGRFECRWVRVRVEENPCVFLQAFDVGDSFMLPVANGEGRFWGRTATLERMNAGKQIALRYATEDGRDARKYPDNPSGSAEGIAGVCDTTGRIFGLMPHPERFIAAVQHPNWRRQSRPGDSGPGLRVFESAVQYARTHL